MRYRPEDDNGNDSSAQGSPKTNPCIGHYFKFCLQLGQFTCVVPFRPTYNNKDGVYIANSNWLQKILTYVLWTFSFLHRTTILRSTWQRSLTEHTPVVYFTLVHAHFHLVLYLVLYRTLLKLGGSIPHLLNLISNSNLLHLSPKRNTAIRIFMYSTQTIWFLFAIVAPVIGYELMDSSEWSPVNVMKTYVAQARYTFFVHNNPDLRNHTCVGLISGWDVFWGILQFMAQCSFVTELFFTISLFENCAVVLWSASSGFKDIIQSFDVKDGGDVEEGQQQRQEDKHLYGERVEEGFEELQEISKCVNDTFHLLAFWYILDIVAWLSTELDFGLRTSDWFVKGHCFYYLTYIGIAFVLSGESFRKVEYARQWLQMNRKVLTGGNPCNQDEPAFMSDYDISRICKTIKSSSVGIGSVGFYKINYSFIGQMLALIITFFTISVKYGEYGAFGTD